MQSSECTLWRVLVSGFLVDVVSNDMLSPIIETRAHRSTASFEWFLCATSDSSDRYSRAAPRLTYRQHSTVFTFTTTMSCVWECCRIAWNKINSLSQTIRSNINPSSTTFYCIWLLSPVSPNSYLFILFTRIDNKWRGNLTLVASEYFLFERNKTVVFNNDYTKINN